MADDTKYNGWTNYETWNVALWIDNEQDTYRYWREQARESYIDAEASKHLTRAEVATRGLATKLKESIEEGNPLASDASMYSDILGAALSEVNYDEIAGNWIEEVATEIDKEEAEEAADDADYMERMRPDNE